MLFQVAMFEKGSTGGKRSEAIIGSAYLTGGRLLS
jgi:hypothetical protein